MVLEEPMVELMAVVKEVELAVAVDMLVELEEQGLEDMAVVKVLAAAVVMLVGLEVADMVVVLVPAVVMLEGKGLVREVADMVVELAPVVVMLEEKGLLREVVDMVLVEVLEEVLPAADMQVDMVEAPAAAQAEVTAVAMLPRSVVGISSMYNYPKMG